MNERVSIIGGGIGGLATALAFQRNNIPCVVYEKSAKPVASNTGLVIGANALKILDHIGIADYVREIGIGQNACTIMSDNGKLLKTLHYPNKSTYFSNYTFIHYNDLIKLFISCLQPGTVQYNKKLKTFTNGPNHVTLQFEDGTSDCSPYVIACDGIHSTVRQTLLPNTKPVYAGYTCWRGILEEVHDYLPKNYFEMWGPLGRVGIYPLTNNRLYWYVFKNSPPNNKELAQMTGRDLVYTFLDYRIFVPQILEKTKEENIIHHDIYELDPLPAFTYNRILLLGDAAHASTPNMGQGAGQAIEDAYILSTLFSQHNSEEAFSIFEKHRIERTQKIVNDSRFIGKVAQMDIPLLCGLRNTALKLSPERIHNSKLQSLFEIKAFY